MAHDNPIVRFNRINTQGLGPSPLDRLRSINNQKTKEVNNISTVIPAAAPFTKSAAMNPLRFTPSTDKKRIKKM
jgi:hypothetical protein